MSGNDIDATKNTNLVKEQKAFPNISFKDIIYPTLNMVFHLIPSKDSQFSFPQDGSIVFSNINVALSYIYQLVEYQKFLQSEEILFLLKGMWIAEPNGSYTQLNDLNLIKLYSLTRQSCLKWKSKGLSLTPVKFTPKSHFVFRFKDNVSFQILFLKIVEDQLKSGKHPTFEEIHQLAIGNGYRSSFYFQNYIEEKDFKRIAFFLLNCPFFNIEDDRIVSLNDFTLEEETKKKNEADLLYSILLRNDPLRKGMKIHDIKKFIGDKFDDKSIKNIIHKDHRFFDYFGYVGIKPKITDFNQLSFDDSNSHNFPPLPIKSSKALQQPNLQNVVFSELYKIQEPLTIESFCSKIIGTEFYEQKQITLISSDEYTNIEKVVSNLPNAIFDDNNNIYPVPLECEIDIFGGLYSNAYQNVVEDNELLRIQTSNQNVSFLYELDKGQLPDYIDPEWYKPDEVYNKIYIKKKKSKGNDEADSDEEDNEKSKNKKKKKEEKKHKDKDKSKKKNKGKNKDDDEEEENNDDSKKKKKKDKKKNKKSKQDESSSSDKDDDDESSESSKDDESESEEEEDENDDSDDQEFNIRYRKRKRKTKQRLPPKHILDHIRSLNLKEEQPILPSDDPNKTNENHPIMHHFSDIKGTKEEPNPNKPPEMTDSQYLIYKAMMDRCGMRNKHIRHFYCRDIAVYLTGEEINGFVMEDTEEAAKVIYDEISHSKFFSSQKSQFAYIPQEEKIRFDQPIYNTFRDMFAGTLKMMHKRNNVDMPIFNYEDTANEMVGIRFYSKSSKSIIQFTKEYKYKQPFTSIAISDDAFLWDNKNKTFGLKKYCPNFIPQKKSEDKEEKLEKQKQEKQEKLEKQKQEKQEKLEKQKQEKLEKQKQEKQEKLEKQKQEKQDKQEKSEISEISENLASSIPSAIPVKKKRGRKSKEEKMAMEAELNKLKEQNAVDDDEKSKEEKRKQRKERREKEKQEKERIKLEKREKERERKEKERLEKKEKREKEKDLKEKKKEKIKKKDSKKIEEEDEVEEEENNERPKRKNSKRIENVLLNIKKARKNIPNEQIRSKSNSNSSSRLSSNNNLLTYTGSDNDLENDDIKNDYDSDYYNNDDENDEENDEREDDYTPWQTPSFRSSEKLSHTTFQDLTKEANRLSLKDENKPFPSFMNFAPHTNEREDMSAEISSLVKKTEMFGDHKYAFDDQIPDLMEKYGKGQSQEDFINNVYFSLGMNYEKELDESSQ